MILCNICLACFFIALVKSLLLTVVPAVQWLRATGISFLSLMTADGSGLILFAEAWWFTISREPRWPVRNVQIHWTKTLIRRLAVARNWTWIAAHASQAKNPLK